MSSEYIRAGAFFTISILLIIHFIFLFKKNTSYISWIIGFVLFVIFPFTWLEDILNYSKMIELKGNTETKMYYWATVVSLIFAAILEITTLIMTIVTNDYIRKKSNQEDESQEETTIEKKSDTLISKNSLNIRIMYAITVSFIIGMVINMFIGMPLADKDKEMMKTGLFVKHVVEFIPMKVNDFETWWREILENIYAPPLLKAVILFCGGFLISFFTIFVKVSNDTSHYDVFFPPMFRTNIKEKTYFILLVLLLSFIITFMAVWFSSLALNLFIPNIESQLKNIILGGIAIISIILNNVLFNQKYPANKHENDYIFLLISFCFALLGTPVTFSILDLIARTGGKFLMNSPLSSNGLIFGIFVSYWLGIFLGGRNWMRDINNKKLKMIIVTIICMLIGMVFALSSHYKVFTMLFGFITFIIRYILKYLGPVVILVLSAYQLYYANQSFHRKNNTTDDYNDESSTFKHF